MEHKCQECDQIFETHSLKANHIRWKHRDNTKYLVKLKELRTRAIERKRGELLTETRNCKKCLLEFTVQWFENNKKIEKKYCSQKCANGHILSTETKNKISKALTKLAKSFNCPNCHNIFWSKKEKNFLF